jgi:hypothetical protein
MISVSPCGAVPYVCDIDVGVSVKESDMSTATCAVCDDLEDASVMLICVSGLG